MTCPSRTDGLPTLRPPTPIRMGALRREARSAPQPPRGNASPVGQRHAQAPLESGEPSPPNPRRLHRLARPGERQGGFQSSPGEPETQGQLASRVASPAVMRYSPARAKMRPSTRSESRCTRAKSRAAEACVV